jgi:hypothetical protein
MSAPILYAETFEDIPVSHLRRVTALAGTGSEVVQGEGPVVKQADVSSITCRVYDIGTDRDAEAGVEVTPAPTLTASANIFDALQTAGWAEDLYGYNFRHDVDALYLADPGEWRLLEYKIVLAAGGSVGLELRVKTKPRIST